MTMKLSQLSFTLLLAAAVAVPAAATDDSALGRGGEIYRLRQAKAGDLFGAAAADPAAPALALETTFADGSTNRLALPGTDDARLEEKAGLLFDEASSSLILYWQSRGADGAVFRFASYDSALSPIGTLGGAGGATVLAADPQLATSRDAFAIQLVNGQVIVAHRTILHLAWRDAATSRARYSPVIFVEGQWVGWTETFDLSGLVRSRHDLADFTPVGGSLAGYLSLRVDEARRAAALTLVDGASGRLSEIEVRYLPMSLEQVGDRVRNRFFRIATVFKPSEEIESANGGLGYNIIHIGLRGLGSEALTALADGLRRGVIQLDGVGCDVTSEQNDVYLGQAGIGKDGVLGLPSNMAGEFMHVAVIGRNPEQLENLVGGLGYNIIHIGSIAAGCNQTGEAHDMIQVASTGEILHIDLTGQRLSLDPADNELFAGGREGGSRDALVASTAVWMRNEVAAPAAVGVAPAQVLLSPSSGDFLVAWVDGQQLRFTQTQQQFWSEPAAVALSTEMSAEAAIELLRKKLR
jgi:hypothetical protein